MKTWFLKNKVFVAGLLSALVLVLQQLLQSGEKSTQAIIYAIGLAIISYVGREWKGQGLSITGIIGTVAYAFSTLQTSGTFTWWEFAANAIIAIILLVIDSLVPKTTPAASNFYRKS